MKNSTSVDLRQDLELAPSPDNTRVWLIIDHLRQKYFQIHHDTLAFLQRSSETESEVSDQIRQDQLSYPSPGSWQELADMGAQRKAQLRTGLMKSYLFWKIPLFNPQPLLTTLWPYISWMFTRPTAISLFMIAILGLVLVQQQWDRFTSTFISYLSWEGALYFGIALITIKVLHELGHAFMAHKYGVPVPVIGMALMLFIPVLYTDTTAGWRISQSKRLMIGAAGMMVELAVASLAIIIWLILPDGPLRGVMFMLAAVGWLVSLAVNLNPLMRFDGYYLASDALGIANLQERGFALGRWQLRECLFGWNVPCPESLPSDTRRIVLIYAYCTWIYRLVLFLGIAVLMFTFIPKSISLPLAAFTLFSLVVSPIKKEIGVWLRGMKEHPMNWKLLRPTLLLAFAIGILFVPWQSRVKVPVYMSSANISTVHAQHSGQIKAIHVQEGDHVRIGDLLFELSSPQLDQQLTQIKAQSALIVSRLRRSHADQQDRSQRQVLEHELAVEQTRMADIEQQLQKLQVRANQDGVVSNLNRELHRERWISPSIELATIFDQANYNAQGYAHEADLSRLQAGSGGWFRPEAPEHKPIPVTLHSIAAGSATDVKIQTLLSSNGGPIETTNTNDGEVVPVQSWYVVKLQLEKKPPQRALRGTAWINGPSQSIAGRLTKHVAGVAIRESGF